MWVKVRAKCLTVVCNISKFCEIRYRLYIIICVTFIQLGANIYDNPSCLQIMKHISNTRVIRRLRKVAKSECYLYRICLSVCKLHLCLQRTNILDILYWENCCLIEACRENSSLVKSKKKQTKEDVQLWLLFLLSFSLLYSVVVFDTKSEQ
jgi:hypothetical protein